MINHQITLLLFPTILFLSGNKSAYGQNSSEKSRKFIARLILPWKVFNMSRELSDRHKKDFLRSREELSKRFLKKPTALTELPVWKSETKKASLNLKRYLSPLIAGSSSNLIPEIAAAAIQPVICPVGDNLLIFTAIIDSLRHNLLAAGHHLVSQAELQTSAKENRILTILRDSLSKATNRALRGYSGPIRKEDALQLSLRETRNITGSYHTSPKCMNLLLSEALARRGYTILYDHGREYLETIRRVLSIAQKPYRNTRVFSLAWSFPPDRYHIRGKFPLRMRVKIRVAESVFGSPLIQSPWINWEFRKSEKGLVIFDLKKEFIGPIKKEKEQLLYKDYPVIVMVNRGWAYVDRGRAWGLKIKDRVTIRGAEQQIKGHVVRFFGPEEKLSNLKGEPISEGAIIFIRKGQRQVRIGQVLNYDKKVFPTPWPPRKAP